MISLDEIVAGAPFFFGDWEAEGDEDGLSSGVVVASGAGDGEADPSGDGVGVATPFFFFFLPEALAEASGEGVGEPFFFFFADADELASGVSAGVGLALDFFFGEADGDFSGDAVGFGVADFSAVAFFFVFLCGVGVGASMFFSLVPNDCWADACSGRATKMAAQSKRAVASTVDRVREMSRDIPGTSSTAVRFGRDNTQFRLEVTSRVLPAPPCST